MIKFIPLLYLIDICLVRKSKDSFSDNYKFGVLLADILTRCTSHPCALRMTIII